jgi:hypothetical protein
LALPAGGRPLGGGHLEEGALLAPEDLARGDWRCLAVRRVEHHTLAVLGLHDKVLPV